MLISLLLTDSGEEQISIYNFKSTVSSSTYRVFRLIKQKYCIGIYKKQENFFPKFGNFDK